MTKINHKVALLICSLSLFACDSSYKPEALKLEQQAAKSVQTFSEHQFPDKLSDWGMFYIQQEQLKLHPSAIPYHLNTPLFSDYAHKFRSLWIPENTTITIEDNRLVFPVGAILSKTFYYPRINFEEDTLTAKQIDKAHSKGTSVNLATNHLIETRLLIKGDAGWNALPYVWNQQQTEASLEITGEIQPITLEGTSSQKFTYIVPDANQCKGCHVTNHTSGKLLPIGLTLAHLNLDYNYNEEITVNQIKHLKDKGLLLSTSEIDYANASHNWKKRQVDINSAARSYLDINCAHCHNPDGPADTSALYLNRANDDKGHLGLCKPPVAAGKGSGNRPFDIYPGNSNNSIISFRMQSNDPSIAMPELGRSIMHEEGVKLINQWINQLDGECEIPEA